MPAVNPRVSSNQQPTPNTKPGSKVCDCCKQITIAVCIFDTPTWEKTVPTVTGSVCWLAEVQLESPACASPSGGKRVEPRKPVAGPVLSKWSLEVWSNRLKNRRGQKQKIPDASNQITEAWSEDIYIYIYVLLHGFFFYCINVL